MAQATFASLYRPRPIVRSRGAAVRTRTREHGQRFGIGQALVAFSAPTLVS